MPRDIGLLADMNFGIPARQAGPGRGSGFNLFVLELVNSSLVSASLERRRQEHPHDIAHRFPPGDSLTDRQNVCVVVRPGEPSGNVALDGQPWCSADRAELLPLVIEKAIYGVPGDTPGKIRDKELYLRRSRPFSPFLPCVAEVLKYCRAEG